MTQMIAHHEGAISVAQTEIEEGQYPPAVAMARSIVNTQQQEIDTMKGIPLRCDVHSPRKAGTSQDAKRWLHQAMLAVSVIATPVASRQGRGVETAP